MMEDVYLESLILTPEGRRLLGEMSASEGLDSIISHHLSMLDISEEWRWEIESAKLEKLREMGEKDGDAALMYKESDKKMQKVIRPKTSADLKKTQAPPEILLTSVVEGPDFNS